MNDETKRLVEAAERFLSWQQNMMELRRNQKVARIIRAGRKWGKVSFKDLRKKFDSEQKSLEMMEPFRRLYLETLFEVNGNLDTIALAQRALVEQSEKRNALLEKQNALLEVILKWEKV